MKREALKALADKVLVRNKAWNNGGTKPGEGMKQTRGFVSSFVSPCSMPPGPTATTDPGAGQDEQALDDAHKYGGKCKCSCFFWKGGGGWWSGYCTRREIKVSHGVTWCPAAEALTGRCDLRKQP